MKISTCIYCFVVLFLCQTISFSQEIQRVRLNFNTPMNWNRDLLLAFTPNNEATDGFDWGYDGGTPLDYPDDLNWLIEEDRCVIQGVGAFDYTKTYPFWLKLSNEGVCSISLTSLENFDEEIDVYIHDSLNDTYTLINTTPIEITLPPDLYSERYYIAFQIPAEKLDVESIESNEVGLVYYRQEKRLKISHEQGTLVQNVEFFNSVGQLLLSRPIRSQTTNELILPFTENEILIVKIDTNRGQVIKRILI